MSTQQTAVEIPHHIEQAIGDAVAHDLEAELGKRGLLQAADRLVAAHDEASQLGARQLTRVVHQCYPISRQRGTTVALEFQSEHDAARVEGALAFGGVTAALLAWNPSDTERLSGPAEFLCAIFNLGVGLVDGLCDGDSETGGHLLEIVHGRDLATAAEERPGRSWLRAEVPPALAADPTVAFTVGVIEAFVETLHDVYPGNAWLHLRRGVGAQLGAALEAERQSVDRSARQTSREQLIECSRRTSVLPFQILQTLADGDSARAQPTAGTLLGEAMWRIDDLVDLCQDASCGALNGVLLAVMERPMRLDRERDVLPALERLLASPDIAWAAAQAAENLLAGLQLAGAGRVGADDHLAASSFLHFIQRYAGIAPRPVS